MVPILFVVPDFAYHGRGRQALLLAAALPPQRFRVRCFCSSGGGPFAPLWRQAQIELLGRSGRRVINLENLQRLRQLLMTERPTVIHAWGTAALRFIRLAAFPRQSKLPPVVVSLSVDCMKRKPLRWWERRVLRHVDAITVNSDAERSALAAAGIAAATIHVIRPGVSVPASTAAAELRGKLGISPTDRLLMMCGHIGAPDRFRDGLWAFDTLRGVDSSVHLCLVGDGPFRERLVDFSMFAQQPGRGVHFLGARPDAPNLLQAAEIVIVPHRRTGGAYAVLEGMAAARPVVACSLPHLQDFIQNGNNGFLVPPGDPPPLVRTLKRLLDDESLRKSTGAAALLDVQTRFRVSDMAERFVGLYDEMAKRSLSTN